MGQGILKQKDCLFKQDVYNQVIWPLSGSINADSTTIRNLSDNKKETKKTQSLLVTQMLQR